MAFFAHVSDPAFGGKEMNVLHSPKANRPDLAFSFALVHSL